MARQASSADSLVAATRGRARFSGHGDSKGASGHREASAVSVSCEFLSDAGQSVSVNRPADGFGQIEIGLAWNPLYESRPALFGLMQKRIRRDIDLDIGCLYELKNGVRGSIQAFGQAFGSLDTPPYVCLSGDERTGLSQGEDEMLTINGAHWPEIKRILLYTYIYQGVPHWADIKPEVQVRMPDENPIVITLASDHDHLRLCVLCGLENVRGGIRLVNYTEFFPGHAEMDRAHGFGINWREGQKIPLSSS